MGVTHGLSKLLFPSASRGQRRRRMRRLWWWLIGSIVLVGGVVGVFYLLYQQGRM